MKAIYERFSPLIFLLFFLIGGCKSEPVTVIDSYDGVSIRFDNEGSGEITLILVHGWANDRSIWDAQVAHFSENYRVIAVDMPGFGESGNNRSDWTISSYSRDISEIIKQLDLNNVVLVGFSMGAPIVVEAAALAQDQVSGVVLVDALQEVELKYPPETAKFMDSVMMDLVNNPTKEKLVAGGFFKKNIDSAHQRVMSFLEGSSQKGWRESLNGVMNWQNERCIEVLRAVNTPIIAINSDMQPTNVESFRKYAPDYKVKIVQNVGHVIMWDKPETFNLLMEESIQEFRAD
ncbi:alpha/beta fold hydrolase [Lentiprolixibacter aurantiacus]|uniref:Alpha/beta hydrolase n=1 Tax=Lentiprolixibacter aurantiacus TaxID=2993939 RepID=A0AAE3MMM3_9FLAO|nr:alpha/beta hydrolase [Lentiprolixibacter aurantiacus]MCX2719632.1 alpha/beta hydrolase [Lentiprolixibacter aurantiacus]